MNDQLDVDKQPRLGTALNPALQLPIVPATPMEMLGRAIQMGQTPETLERLLSLQERWERNEARKAYDEAMAAAAAELPPVLKDATVSHGAGKAQYKHETLGAIEKAVRPVLSRHGLHYRWRTNSENPERIMVTCIISGHGYHEENSLAGPPDQSGAKNAIQAIGSTTTYLQRYTLKAALGIAATEDDDAGGLGEYITATQVGELQAELVRLNRTEEAFCQWQKINKLELMPAERFEPALRMLKGLGKKNAPANT